MLNSFKAREKAYNLIIYEQKWQTIHLIFDKNILHFNNFFFEFLAIAIQVLSTFSIHAGIICSTPAGALPFLPLWPSPQWIHCRSAGDVS